MEKVSDLEVQRLWGYSPGASLGTGAATVSGRLRGLLWMGAIALGLHYNDMLWSSLKLLALVAIAMAFLLIANQSRMLYAPQPDPRVPRGTAANPPGFRSPREMGITRFEDVRIRTSDSVTLHGWLILQSASRDVPTLVFFHGNAGNIGHRLPNLRTLRDSARCNLLCFDYRGYGDSSDAPITEVGLREDARSVARYLWTRGEVLDLSRVVLFGRSLGGAVATQLAAEIAAGTVAGLPPDAVRGLILENTFTSVEDMAMHLFPVFRPVRTLVRRLIQNQWRTMDLIPLLRLPMLFLSATEDEIVPVQHMQRLYSLSGSPLKRLHVVQGGHHNDLFLKGGQPYYAAISAFLSGQYGDTDAIPEEVDMAQDDQDADVM